MKHIFLMATLAVASLLTQAQTLNVVMGSITLQYPAAQTGSMTYSENGQTLTIDGKSFSVSDISRIYIDETVTGNNTVSVNYDGTTASVAISGNIAPYVTATVSGAHVSVEQSSEVDENVGEITYILSGASSDGEFYMTGSYKATVELNGLTLTNRTPVYSGAALCIMDGKRIDLSVRKDTENTLTDAATGSQKAALYCKGHLELKGKGTLNVYGKLKHAIKSAEYLQMKNCTVNVMEAVGDGISCDEYFLMESGTLNIKGVGDEGIQCDIDGTASTGTTADHEDEDSGSIYITGGTINVSSKKSEGIEAKGTLDISGGQVYAEAKDDAINSGSHMTISGGYVCGYSTGNDGIDANGNMYIKGGLVYAICSGSPEVGLDANTERGYKLYVTGGTVIAVGGLERGSSLTQSCYQASSWSRNTWYALAYGSETFAFKTPSSGGSGLVVSASSAPSLKSGVTVSGGTSCFGGMGVTDGSVSGGTAITLSSYTGEGGGMGPGGGGHRW